MPSNEELQQQAEDWKAKGNASFQKGETTDAVSSYSQGIVVVDRIQPPPLSLKATLLSNRAMCHLKLMDLDKCIDDCTTGLTAGPGDTKLRNKLLFRRAKARFLTANLPTKSTIGSNDELQDAAKDLLQLLQADAKNSEANQLLTAVRAQYKSQQTAVTPVSKAVDKIRQKEGDILYQVKLLLGMLENDLNNTAMELGRIGAVPLLFEQAMHEEGKLSTLSIQCVSQSATYPFFVRKFLVNHQKDVLDFIANERTDEDAVVFGIAVFVRTILHADRDDPDKDIENTTLLDTNLITDAINTALERFEGSTSVIRAVLDLILTWTSGAERDSMIRASLGQISDPTLPLPTTQAEYREMTPKKFATTRKRESDKKKRDEGWRLERCKALFRKCLATFLDAACKVEDHIVRREMSVAVGRLLNVYEDDDPIKDVVRMYLQHEGPKIEVIEEVYNEDGEEKVNPEDDLPPIDLVSIMKKAIITSALLLSKKEVGAWAIGSGWTSAGSDVPNLINSGDSRAMCLASEVISAAATVETTRHLVSDMIGTVELEKLLTSDDKDIRSGAASAIAKVGMSKEAQRDEGEIMGQLQAACELLEDDMRDSPVPDKKEARFQQFSKFSTSSVERAIEMLSYIISSTTAKEELAAGFKPRANSITSLERLVNTTSIPNAGESLTGFALASIFQNMAGTNTQIRREGFEGKEVTMEQYDEMQKLGKTEEEKEIMAAEVDPDTTVACHERIRKMASLNVPRAMVSLTEGASEHTLEQLVIGMNRMADEVSVRGMMIQQGVLSSCIKIEKNEGPTETDTMKKVIRLARHCIAKLLVTTNPSLLTAAQRLGSVKPLIQLVRDNKASDLQQFEGLLSLTNIGASGEDAQNRIISERGIPCMHFAMFSDHEMVRRAATEAMTNLIPHKDMMKHMLEGDNLKLWLAFASDYEENYECARAATGGLAMATQDPAVAAKVVELQKFRSETELLLQSGRLEIMHRAFVFLSNLVAHGGISKTKVIGEGLLAFCEAYVDSYHNGSALELDFSEEELSLLPVTIEAAKSVVAIAQG